MNFITCHFEGTARLLHIVEPGLYQGQFLAVIANCRRLHMSVFVALSNFTMQLLALYIESQMQKFILPDKIMVSLLKVWILARN